MYFTKTTNLVCIVSVTWLASFGTQALAAPAGGNISFGDGTISQNGVTTSITQNSDRLAIDWESFNIADGEQVIFAQPDAQSIALNQDFSGSASELFGDLTANGQVFLLNPAGVLIGTTGTIDTAGLLISDRNLAGDDFSASSLLLEADAELAGGIENQGTITTGAGGAHFVASRMTNSGSVQASDGGDLTFTFADSTEVALSDANQLTATSINPLSTTENSGQALLANNSSGSIVSIGGNIYITADYYDDLDLSGISNDGQVNALVANGEGGRVFLVDNSVTRPFDESIRDQIISDQDSSPAEESPGSSDFTGGGLDAIITLDDLVSDCTPADEANGANCEKENAIKRYLGRMLINGRLPR